MTQYRSDRNCIRSKITFVVLCLEVSRCRWTASQYAVCSQTCEGVQRRNVSCTCSLPDGSPAIGTDADCDRDDPRLTPIDSRSCGVECASYSWLAGNWSSCSNVCAPGTRTRTVSCLKERMGRVFITGERDCLDPAVAAQIGSKPVLRESCDFPCSYSTGAWSECNVTCGGGERNRSVTCQRIEEDGSTRTVAISDCEADASQVGPKPPARQECNTDECGKAVID